MSQESRAGVSGSADTPPEKKNLTIRQAAFIGVGAMVGAGIFALLGAAGEVAGAAVWLSFLIAGVVAALQGYSFAKLGARYPSAGGLLEYVAKRPATATSPGSPRG
jgi:amino acid transporter